MVGGLHRELIADYSAKFKAILLWEGSFFHLMLQSNNKGGGGGPTEIRGKNFFFFVTMAGKSGFFQQQELVHFGRLTPPQCGRIPEMQMRVFSDVHVHCALLLQ